MKISGTIAEGMLNLSLPGLNQGASDGEGEFDWEAGDVGHWTGGKWPTFGVA